MLLFTLHCGVRQSDVQTEGGVFFCGLPWAGITFLHCTGDRCQLLLPWGRGDQATDGGDSRRAGLPGRDADDVYLFTDAGAGTGLAAEWDLLVRVRCAVLSVCTPGAGTSPCESKNALRVRA